MSTQDQEIKDVLTRLSLLETSDTAKTAEICSLRKEVTTLQKENATLQRDILQLHRENLTMRETIDVLEQNDTARLAEIHSLQSETNALQKDILQLHRDNLTLKEKSDAAVENEKAVTDVERAVDQKMSALSVKTQNIAADVHHVIALRRVLSKMLVDKQDSVDLVGKIDALAKMMDSADKRILLIENRLRGVTRSVTMARVEPRGGLSMGQCVKLDKCVWVLGTGGEMDQTCGRVNVGQDGDYCVGVMYAQFEDGDVELWMKWGGEGGGSGQSYFGKTTGNDDVRCSVTVMAFKKGDKVWLEAVRVRGQGRIGWCLFYSWLLSP